VKLISKKLSSRHLDVRDIRIVIFIADCRALMRLRNLVRGNAGCWLRSFHAFHVLPDGLFVRFFPRPTCLWEKSMGSLRLRYAPRILTASSASDTVRLAQFNSHSFRFSPVTFASASAPISAPMQMHPGFAVSARADDARIFSGDSYSKKMKIPIARSMSKISIKTLPYRQKFSRW